MHLKQLKLAGFKSFVEATAVPFPSQLVAVVGPNGCGKSNIIDAVRWVMGESSARNLRGECMADVIFNGSLNRKPVGQAAVELVFDNSLGRLSGQYANYQEVAIKRVVTRDNEAKYYLNGTRCRRRDIQDIFLGTGAGAKGYAIIGQDMISKIIEARPEELKQFFEEAAGVSKYKERRRETLQRISHTRENLARMTDMLDELQKQITRLERQAKAAKRYQLLKKEERLYKAQVLAMKWDALKKEQQSCEQSLNALLEQSLKDETDLTRMHREQIQGQTLLDEAQHEQQMLQNNVYQHRHEVVRLEDALQQKQHERQRLGEDKQIMQDEYEALLLQLKSDEADIQHSDERLVGLVHTIAEKKLDLKATKNEVDQRTQHLRQCNEQLQVLQNKLHQAQQAISFNQIELNHLNERRQDVHTRHEQLESELQDIQLDALEDALKTLDLQHDQLSQEKDQAFEAFQEAGEKRAHTQALFTACEENLHRLQVSIHDLTTQYAAAEAAQKADLKSANEAANHPFWSSCPTLVELLTVEKSWLKMCEWVLAERLYATVVDAFSTPFFEHLSQFDGQSAVFMTQEFNQQRQRQTRPVLRDKITGTIPGLDALNDIYTAATLKEAQNWVTDLSPHQSIVTQDGYWLGRGWLRYKNMNHVSQEGLLARQHHLHALKRDLNELQVQYDSEVTNRESLHQALTAHIKDEHSLKDTFNLKKEAIQHLTLTREAKQNHIKQARRQKERLFLELETLQAATEELSAKQMQAENALAEAKSQVAAFQEEQETLLVAKQSAKKRVQQSQNDLDSQRQIIHETELLIAEEKAKLNQLKDNMRREQHRSQQLKERIAMITERLSLVEHPEAEDKQILEDKLYHLQALEHELSLKTNEIATQQNALRDITLTINEKEAAQKKLNEAIQSLKMQKQAQEIQSDNLNEAMTELSEAFTKILPTLPDDLRIEQREKDILNISQQIKSLGAINLVAIEEYDTELRRQEELNAQRHDLTAALATLEAAIRRMDKETELRLKDTFHQVNTAFQSLFPRLFGGGRARLELTCDNLLEAGILVMAQPPGKKNSTIHMLSGGEKAMTAIALVFAIFQLNPAPFCMLDEVDAPLDDANVRRFCDLVKEMSQFVQFLFITHNKMTMELADHLIGVTMREPGVSRIVAVDVEQALSIVK